MKETVISKETQQVIDNYELLMKQDRNIWKKCMQSLLDIAERGIKTAVRDANRQRDKPIDLTIAQIEDLQQDAMLKLHQGLATLKDGLHMANRLWRMAKNTTTDLIKSSAFNKNVSIQALEAKADKHGQTFSIEKLQASDKSSDSPSDDFLWTEKVSLIKKALDMVGDTCKTLLVEICENKKSYEELAEQFNESDDWVDNNLRNCKKRWLELFEKIIGPAQTPREMLDV